VPATGSSFGRLFSKPTAALDYARPPEVPAGINLATGAGDWDNGPGLMVDGPYINKADEGNTPGGTLTSYIGDYYFAEAAAAQSRTFFSPNKQVSSPVMFGSLPVGLRLAAPRPWQTLLFRPSKLTGVTHPGGADPRTRDHLLLDLFWMPVVEPYMISEPLATTGKINLNYQIAPFTYIKRDTGLRAVLKPVMITALNPTAASNRFMRDYKNGGSGINNGQKSRWEIDLDATLKQFDDRFVKATHTAANPNFFVSASEICDIPLVPLGAGVTGSSIATFWGNNKLTGDNSLERPYSHIYPRVTTKSNVFTVHVRAQSLKKSANDADQNKWKENRDQVTGEFRGSFVIEKYYDPNEANIMLNAANSIQNDASDANVAAGAAVRGTRWRMVGTKQFGQ
jgi:uncharacterized protein (TIGR02600 family)